MSEMIEAKTADLAGEALNWAVAIAAGHKPFVQAAHYGIPDRVFLKVDRDPEDEGSLIGRRYKPFTDWAIAGPLLVRYNVAPVATGAGEWIAGDDEIAGPTALVAMCRAIVVDELGDTVQVPKELMPCS